MTGAHSSPRQHERPFALPRRRDGDREDISGIIEENRQLRELVIQLSKIVVRNVVDRK